MTARFRLRQVGALAEIPAAAWDACANPQPAPSGVSESFNPFLSHGFLSALEQSGCVGGRSGWSPAHLALDDAEGALVGAVPLYFKSHSMGEYVFDHGLAEAFERAGGKYYPKAQVAIPFTPAQGRRLLTRANAPVAARKLLADGLREVVDQTGVSSLHVTFPDESDQQFLAAQGFVQRKGLQFHFFNRGYRDFGDYLDALSSRKRKAVKRERAEALAAGLTIERVSGAELTEAHWDAFFEFYTDTSARKWGRPYLNRAFFSFLSAALSERILLVIARRGEKMIAGALNLIGDQALYGRNWGAIEHHPCLHFELCYYQAIDFALERGLKRVEAGAQGEHKFSRGYEAVETFSSHIFAHAGLAAAAEDFFEREARHLEAAIADYAQNSPFKKA